jgi:hypothetical protein
MPEIYQSYITWFRDDEINVNTNNEDFENVMNYTKYKTMYELLVRSYKERSVLLRKIIKRL